MNTGCAENDVEKSVLSDLQAGKTVELCGDIEKRTLSGKFITRLCMMGEATSTLHPYGVRIQNAVIENGIDLQSLHIPFNVVLINCTVNGELDLRNAEIRSLDLSGTHIEAIHADGLVAKGDVCLSDACSVEHSACFQGAVIQGNLRCVNGIFRNAGVPRPVKSTRDCGDCRQSTLHAYALILRGARIGGDVLLCGSRLQVEGGVCLGDCTVEGNVNCTYGTFETENFCLNTPKLPSGRRLHCAEHTVYHCRCAFNAEGMSVHGNLLMSDVVVHGETRLTNMRVERDFDAANGAFIHQDGYAIYGDRMQVEGNAFFSDGFEAQGAIRLPRARIGTDLSLFGSRLGWCNEQSRSLYCEGIHVQGTIYLNHIEAEAGYLDFSYAVIGGNFNCVNARLLNTGSYALKARGMKVGGSVFLCSEYDKKRTNTEAFKALSTVCLTGSKIGMDLICHDATFINTQKNEAEDSYQALLLKNMCIEGKVECTGKCFLADGGIDLDYTRIGSYLDLGQATLLAPSAPEEKYNYALAGGKLVVHGSLYIREHFTAKGLVMLNEAQVGRNLIVKNATIKNRIGAAVVAQQMNIYGCIKMNKFCAIGEVCFENTSVGGHVLCQDSTLENPSYLEWKVSVGTDQDNAAAYALNAEGMKIGGEVNCTNLLVFGVFSLNQAEIKRSFIWKDIFPQSDFSLFLAGAQIGVLDDEPKSWPKPGNLRLTDFKYNYVLDLQPENIKKRYTSWLKLTREFRPQPYEQLAAVLRKCGYEEEAMEVMIEKNRRSQKEISIRSWLPNTLRRKQSAQSQSFFRWLLLSMQGGLVGYGYKPGNAVKLGVSMILLGWFVFHLAFTHHLMVPLDPKSSDRNVYQIALIEKDLSLKYGVGGYAFVYSLDTFIPIITLQTSSYWLPTVYPNKAGIGSFWGYVICIYRWIHIVCGWVISSMFVIALSRFSQK